jgi:glycerol uptake facilitator protein
VARTSRAGGISRAQRRWTRDVPGAGAGTERPPKPAAPGDLGRRVVAEVLGTSMLVLFGAGSVVAALSANDGVIDYAALGMISIAFAVVVAVVIYAFGTTSGAHINPAVTLTLAARGRFPAAEVLPYLAAQFAGGVLGALLIIAVFGDAAVDLGGTGGTALADGVSLLRGVVAEAAGTFLLVIAIFALAVDRRAPTGWAGFVIGLAVACAVLLIGPITGGSLNPARTFGPLLTTTLWGGDTTWGDLPVYLIGPVVGGVLAGLTYDFVARPREAEAAGQAQGTAGDIEGRRESGR